MRKIAIIGLSTSLLLVGAGCSLLPKQQLKTITLEYWSTDGASTALTEPIADYKKLHPNITVNIQSFPEDEYSEKLVEALAEDRGPDIFQLSNTDLLAWESKIVPMPKETQVLTPTVDKNKQITVAPQKSTTITIKKIRDDYVEAVSKDVIWLGPAEKAGDPKTNRIWGLPLSLGNLALYYNRDLLKKADIEAHWHPWRSFPATSAKAWAPSWWNRVLPPVEPADTGSSMACAGCIRTQPARCITAAHSSCSLPPFSRPNARTSESTRSRQRCSGATAPPTTTRPQIPRSWKTRSGRPVSSATRPRRSSPWAAPSSKSIGKVPETMEDFVRIPGVGRKTANVVLGTWFLQPAITVDTHVARLSERMELSKQPDPEKIERNLMEVFPEPDWTFASHALIWHGRRVCAARRPLCDRCELRPDCPYPSRARPANPR